MPPNLSSCPFCKGTVDWCEQVNEDCDECHIIECTQCQITFDMVKGQVDAETIDDLKTIAATKFNKRPVDTQYRAPKALLW